MKGKFLKIVLCLSFILFGICNSAFAEKFAYKLYNPQTKQTTIVNEIGTFGLTATTYEFAIFSHAENSSTPVCIIFPNTINTNKEGLIGGRCLAYEGFVRKFVNNEKINLSKYEYEWRELSLDTFYRELANLRDERAKERLSQDFSLETVLNKEEANYFAKKIKKAVNKKDIYKFAELISYPIDIYVGKSDIKIKNKEEFIKLGLKKIFTPNFIKQINEEDLFYSWRGYMMGNDPNLFFDYINHGALKIYAINIEDEYKMVDKKRQAYSRKNKHNTQTFCLNGKTSLSEYVKACIMYSADDLKNNFAKDSKYNEVVINKIDFYIDGINLSNNLDIPTTDINILGIKRIYNNESLTFAAVLIDKSWEKKGLKIGSVLRPQNINTGQIQDKGIRYYIVGYLKNASKDGLYIITDVDVDSMFYGSCGRGCHYDSFEQIEYKSK